jgi:hypothetical protein
MKIALLFAGRIKSWELCWPNFNRYIKNQYKGHIVHGFLCHNEENPLPNIRGFSIHYNIQKYENIKIDTTVLESLIPLNSDPVIKARYQSFKMYFCWHRAYELMKSMGIDYDIVIYLRADMVLNERLVLPDLPLADNTLYIPSLRDNKGLNDQLAFGSMKAMEHYTNIYSNLDKIYETTKIPFHTETYVKLHNESMIIKRFPLKYILHPKRF